MSDSFAMADLTAGQLNQIVLKLGGHAGAIRFLNDELAVVERESTEPKPTSQYSANLAKDLFTRAVLHKEGMFSSRAREQFMKNLGDLSLTALTAMTRSEIVALFKYKSHVEALENVLLQLGYQLAR